MSETADAAPVAQTTLGPVQGTLQVDGAVSAFLGVPFGKAQRWKKPQSADAWTDTRSAAEFGPAPPRLPDPLAVLPMFKASGVAHGEDCLNANVWVPRAAKAPEGGFPVLLWIFGGSLATGENSLPVYDGRYLVAQSVALGKPVVVVSINYRLNVFGFLASKEFQEWNEDGSTGNLGLLDMRLGIQWAKANAKSFGGNPDLLTVFGESAGAMAIDLLSTVFADEQLFTRAILQSGNALAKPVRTVAESQALFELFYKTAEGPADLTGKARIEFLLTKSTEDLLTAFKKSGPALTFTPTLDGVFLKTQPASMPRGPLEQVLVGTNLDEGSMFGLAYLMAGEEGGKKFIAGTWPKHAQEILDKYAAEKYGDSFKNAFNAFFGDASFHYPMHAFTQQMVAKGGGVQVYKYRFEVPLANSQKPFGLGAHHGAEIPFIFHATHLLTPEEAKIADTISSHWINFAYDGSPGQDFPEVPKLVVYGKDRVKVEEDNYRSEEMEFWARLFADRAAGKVAN